MDFATAMNNATKCGVQIIHQKTSPMPLSLVILFAIAACIIFVLTTFGNLLVLCFKARVGRTNTTLLVWNLGLTDFLVGVIVLPLGALHVVLRDWPFGRPFCRLWVAADVTFCTCSVVTICVISVDRYLAVTTPLRYKTIVTKAKVIFTIASIWCFSLSILLATIKWDQPQCYNSKICFAGNEIRYLAHSVVFAFFIPASVTLTLYWRIYRLAQNRQKALDRGFVMILGQNMNFLTNTLSQHAHLRVHYGKRTGMVEHQRRVLRTHERIAKTLGVVSCSFLFCWLPFFTLYLTRYCNSMLNPIIYSFTVREFKRTAIKIVIPVWKTAHRLIPSVIAAPPEHITSRFSRKGARATRVKPRVYLKCKGHRQNSLRQCVKREETAEKKLEEKVPVPRPSIDEISDSGDSKECVMPRTKWQIEDEVDTVEQEEVVDKVIEDQRIIRAHSQENDDILYRAHSGSVSKKRQIHSRNGVHITKAKRSNENARKVDPILAQITDV